MCALFLLLTFARDDIEMRARLLVYKYFGNIVSITIFHITEDVSLWYNLKLNSKHHELIKFIFSVTVLSYYIKKCEH